MSSVAGSVTELKLQTINNHFLISDFTAVKEIAMLYYSFNVELASSVNNGFLDYDFTDKPTFEDKICSASRYANDRLDDNVHFFVVDTENNLMKLVGIIGYKNTKEPADLVCQFVRDLELEPKNVTYDEITASELRQNLRRADKNKFIDDNEEIVIEFNIPSEYKKGRLRDHEFIAEKGCHEDVLDRCATTFLGKDLKTELERVFSVRNESFIGHPVHYAFISDDYEDCKKAIGILVSALHAAGRLRSRRISVMRTGRRFGMKVTDKPTLDIDDVSGTYRIIAGGTIVLIPEELDYESETADPNMCNVDDLASEIVQHRRDCLTVLVFGKNNIRSLDKLKSRLGNIRIVDIRELSVSGQEAKDILKEKALESNIQNYESLLSIVDKDGEKAYYPADINHVFNDWLDNHLCTEFFTQYKNLEASGRNITPITGDAYHELERMIGLDGAKKTVRQAIDFNKFQNRYFNDISPMEKPTRHMVFTGNPGTAKTTVARLFAQIMKDNQVLPKGNLIEVGRKDLVGKYVGWTARLVEEAFNKARGSVLFIDEAYSLCDDRAGMYGDEAINTIVQMMENRREDTIVIFAGYPDKMKAFLEKNPGLRSRIAFHVDFDDYDENQLMQILRLMADKNNIKLDFGVSSKVRTIVRQAMSIKDFGNGRFIRNMFEKARMAQASRIMAMADNDVDADTINTLIADDFEIPDEIKPKYMFRPIGFAS